MTIDVENFISWFSLLLQKTKGNAFEILIIMENMSTLLTSDLFENTSTSFLSSESLNSRQTTSRERIPLFLQYKKPPFFKAYKISPPAYLKELKEYLDLLNIRSDQFKLICVKRGLNTDNKTWFEKFKFKTFAEFEIKFLQKFWSFNEKEKYRSCVFNENFQSINKTETLSKFSARQFHKRRLLYPEMPFSEAFIRFVNLLPQTCAYIILSIEIKDEEALNELMLRFDIYGPEDFVTGENKYSDHSGQTRSKSGPSKASLKRKRRRLNKKYKLLQREFS